MASFEGIQDAAGGTILDGDGVNVVAVIVIEDQEVVVAGARGEHEAPCLIGEDFA